MLYDETMRDISTSELWKLQLQRSEIAKQYLSTWNSTAKNTKSGRPIDGIIRLHIPLFITKLVSPVTPYPAVLHDHFEAGVGYSAVWNLLGIPTFN